MCIIIYIVQECFEIRYIFYESSRNYTLENQFLN